VGYCSIVQVRSLLPKFITIGDQNITTPTIEAPASSFTVDSKTAGRFIEFSTQHIDSRLRPVYVVPLRRIKVIQTNLLEDARANSKDIQVYDNGTFTVGSLLRFSDSTGTELHEILSLPDEPNNIHTVSLTTGLSRVFRATDTRVSMVEFPDPIPIMCARITAATILDRQYTAEQEPDVSTYGKSLRTLASQDMDSILMGQIRLNGQDHTGRRFLRTQLKDTWSTPAEFQPGQGKEV
jgi:hypothetical protein